MALSVVALALASGCGLPTTDAGRVSMPMRSGMRDAAITVSGINTTMAGQLEVFGEGVLVLQGGQASWDLTTRSPFGEKRYEDRNIYAAGTEYMEISGLIAGRSEPNVWWVSHCPATFDPALFSKAKALRLLGEEELPSGLSWHYSGQAVTGERFEAFIRKQDGYLLRAVVGYPEDQVGQEAGRYRLVLDFSDFNRGRKVTLPDRKLQLAAPDQSCAS